MVSALAGPLGYWVSGGLLAAYVIVGLAPFDWQPPHRLDNGAEVVGQQLRFASPGIAWSQSPDWITAAIENEQIVVGLRVRSLVTAQSGPARIFTISTDSGARNLTLGQEGDGLAVRVRTPATSWNGKPESIVPGVFSTSDWCDLKLAIHGRQLDVWVNDAPSLQQQLAAEPFSNWNPGFDLALGNELSGDRPWLGEISRATVTVAGQDFDYLQQQNLQLPRQYWVGLRTRLFYPFCEPTGIIRNGALGDVLLNFVCFVPLGFSLMLCCGSLFRAVSICATTSLAIEVLQLFFSRFPSLVDVAMNATGALVGAWIALWLIAEHRKRTASASMSDSTPSERDRIHRPLAEC